MSRIYLFLFEVYNWGWISLGYRVFHVHLIRSFVTRGQSTSIGITMWYGYTDVDNMSEGSTI